MSKLLDGLHIRFEEASDASLDHFFKERPFLTGGKPEIVHDTEREDELQMELDEVITALNKAAKEAIPPIKLLSGKQNKLLD